MNDVQALSNATFERGLQHAASVALFATFIFLPACHDSTAPASGRLTASIREGVDPPTNETVYDGTGSFRVGKDPGASVSVAFGLHSVGTATSTGQSLGLYRPGQGKPAPGRHELAPLRSVDGHLDGFTAHYHRNVAGRAEDFAALSGYVIVTASSDDLIVGEFQATMVRYCLANEVPGSDDWCTAPTTITAGAPTIKVVGSFYAVRATIEVAVPTRP